MILSDEYTTFHISRNICGTHFAACRYADTDAYKRQTADGIPAGANHAIARACR